jgi:hypothetical protein
MHGPWTTSPGSLGAPANFIRDKIILLVINIIFWVPIAKWGIFRSRSYIGPFLGRILVPRGKSGFLSGETCMHLSACAPISIRARIFDLVKNSIWPSGSKFKVSTFPLALTLEYKDSALEIQGLRGGLSGSRRLPAFFLR